MSAFALITLLAAGAVAMPAPVGDRDNWFGMEDIPQSQFAAGKNGVFYYKALVAPDGKVETCEVTASGANKKEQADFCKTARHRMRYQNAVDQTGLPSYYVVDENFVFAVPDQWKPNLMRSPANVVIDVARLADANSGRIDVPVNVSVDAAGGLRTCNAPNDAKSVPLAQLACKELQSLWRPLPENNAAGKPVAYIRQLRVELREVGSPR